MSSTRSISFTFPRQATVFAYLNLHATSKPERIKLEVQGVDEKDTTGKIAAYFGLRTIDLDRLHSSIKTALEGLFTKDIQQWQSLAENCNKKFTEENPEFAGHLSQMVQKKIQIANGKLEALATLYTTALTDLANTKMALQKPIPVPPQRHPIGLN
jgi:hypothetical protein